LRCVSDDSGQQTQEARRVVFVGYSETEKNFRVFDREKRKVFVSCNIKFNETKTTPIMDEFYCEQEIGSGYGSQEAQNSRDKKSGTIETPRRSQRERKQPDWLSYSSIAEFAYSAVVCSPLTFDEAVESSDKKKWRVAMDEEIDAHYRNVTWKLVPRPVAEPVMDNKWVYRIKTDGGSQKKFSSSYILLTN